MGPVKAGKYEYNHDALVVLRQKLGLKQSKMAELIGVPPNTLSRWETGATKPDAESLAAIYSVAVERGVTPDFFQRRKAVPRIPRQLPRPIVAWNFQNASLSTWSIPRAHSWIMDLIAPRPNASNALLKAFASSHQIAEMDKLEELGWRVFHSDQDLVEDIISDTKSDCGQAPDGSYFVLIANSGNYLDLFDYLREVSIPAHLVTTDLVYASLLDAVGREHRSQMPYLV